MSFKDLESRISMPPRPASPHVGLFVTCLVDAMRPSIGFASLKLLEDAGCIVGIPEAQTCCGQPAFNSGADGHARDQIMKTLVSTGIPTAIYYPRPLHEQAAYSSFPSDPEGLPHSTRAAQCVFSLPMHPYLETADQDYVIETLQQCS